MSSVADPTARRPGDWVHVLFPGRVCIFVLFYESWKCSSLLQKFQHYDSRSKIYISIKNLFDASIDDAVVDPHRLNCARTRLARLAHWNSGNEEVSFDRVEFAISVSKQKYPSSKWRVQTLATLMTQKTTGE